MPITNGYATLSELKARLTIEVADTQDDAMLEACIEGASRLIDGFTGTRFYTASEVRYYTALDPLRCIIDDATSVSAVAQDLQEDRTYSDTLSSGTDYELLPDNANLNGRPWQQLAIVPRASKTFIPIRRGIRVTGTFGYSATVPPGVKQACLLISAALFRRKDAPFGTAGGGEVGTTIAINGLDPQARNLLAPFRRIALVGLV
jgi:hypothetical protein